MAADVRAPEDMRRAVASYVAAAHRAYLRAVQLLPPATSGDLPLLSAGPFSVAAAGAGDLHIVATTQALGPVQGVDAGFDVCGEDGPLRWRLRFYDPVVLPELGLIAERGAEGCDPVRRVLGVRTWLYHLIVPPGSQLGEHHASHAGTALAHTHAAAARDFEAIRAHVPSGREALVVEMEGAARAGLVRAQAVLARAIAPGDPGVEAEADRLLAPTAPMPDPEPLRRALLSAVRAAGPGVAR